MTKRWEERRVMTITGTSYRYEHLRFAVKEWVELSDRQWGTFKGIFHQKTVSANDHLLYPGSTEYELIFVCDGLLRFYYLAEDGTESNKAFVTGGNFAGPLAAATLGLPIIYGVEALEDTPLLAADFRDFTALFEEHPVFDRFGRKLAELLLRRKELRTRSLLQKSATERYIDFRLQHADLVKRVPQFHIASYLGVTESSLSRIKREVARGFA